ncbi:MAG: DUF362 domain-containing protein [Clostridiales bacterium]|nr:DUF362 domain-containing protein [Clostridiales bacterium]
MSKVAIVKCNDYQDDKVYKTVKECFDLLGGLNKFVKKGMKVAIKPNLLMAKSPDGHATTHPSIIAAIGRLIIECGGTPLVVESPGGPYFVTYLKATYKACGMTAMSKKYNIPLNTDLSTIPKIIKTERNTRKITVLKPLLDCDLIINASKMKTHAMMIFTGAIKNMFGAIAGTEKATYHINASDYDKFANELIDIFQTVVPTLNVMDGIIGMEGEGPAAGNPKQVGVILASTNGFSLDSVAHDILLIDKEQSYILKNAKLRGISIDYDLIGSKLDEVIINDFNIPYQLKKGLTKNLFWKITSNSKSKPVVIKDKCVGCEICKNNCPAECIVMVDKKPVFDYDACIRCFCCQELCPKSAIIAKKPFIHKLLSGGR